MNMQSLPVGELLREWRQRRRLSQLAFACDAEISARHLSFLETGRSKPSRQMLLHLADLLEVPFRERNSLLLAAGYAPVYSETRLDSPDAAAARRAVDLVLASHEPFPALAIDRHWNLVAANRAVPLFLAGIPEELLQPPINVLRLSLHPQGLGPRIENLGEWRAHVFMRLQHQIDLTNDEGLIALVKELETYPGGLKPRENHEAEFGGLIVPLKLKSDAGTLSFFTATTVFGTAVDITFSELIIESFMPGDAFTAAAVREAMGE
ncbi:helix-turn-helix domain-containing protein [Parvibaculum sp.]|uniref:helix-turn-helix domain-containing protein n=1 Tax=Parvibaculum sp. TaxID=2024848 RepID=UPI002730DF04|nr:helix-turn-helix transcriptional regulator [Parvibaculum sp.]MDP1626644.1 helix-turn-helix transcriptional regulator [Parvibaculum sp.]MDP2150565.1 helix-turn-helix transcriptional regulator [Parvibaculum sp.]MDP3329581.1 helix-turn-helix transcriptional regulator [Parvibaculum sp.]